MRTKQASRLTLTPALFHQINTILDSIQPLVLLFVDLFPDQYVVGSALYSNCATHIHVHMHALGRTLFSTMDNLYTFADGDNHPDVVSTTYGK